MYATTILSAETFEQDGEQVNRILMDVNGHQVQVVAYDLHPMLTVLVDDIAEQVHLITLQSYLAKMCKDKQP